MRTSSVIASLDYSPRSHTLEVAFHSGRVYRYLGVPKSRYQALMEAPSLGGYFNREIKPRYPATEIVGEPTPSSRRSSRGRARTGRS